MKEGLVFTACRALFAIFLALGVGPAVAQEASREQLVAKFFSAIEKNEVGTVNGMMVADSNLVRAVYYGRRPLIVAASKGQIEIIDCLLRAGADVNEVGDTMETSGHRLTALIAAVWYDKTNACKRLLDVGANPNIAEMGGDTALHYAFEFHRIQMAEWLLDHGANPFLRRRNRETPLHLSVVRGNGELVSRILKDSAQYFKKPTTATNASSATRGVAPIQSLAELISLEGAAFLQTAVQRGELEATQAFLRAGVSAKDEVQTGVPIIRVFAVAEANASRGKDFDLKHWLKIRDLLISNGAEYDVFAATAMGDLDRVRRLAAQKGMADSRDKERQTPLHWAVSNQQPAMASFWLGAGGSPAAVDLNQQTPLHIAAARGFVEETKLLLAAQAPATAIDLKGKTPLDLAVAASQAGTIRLLLAEKSVPPQSGRAISLPIHEAAASGNLNALTVLAEATNNLEARNELGLTPLQVAVQNTHFAAAAMLVDKGANINARDPEGNTLLIWIVPHAFILNIRDQPPTSWFDRMGQDPRMELVLQQFKPGQYGMMPREILRAVAFLIAGGIDLNATNTSGKTALQLVTEDTSPLGESRGILLKLVSASGGSLDKPVAGGNTALQLAGQDTDSQRAAGLVAGGADINATNAQGRTALHNYAAKIYVWDNNESGTGSPFQFLVRSKANVNAQDSDGLTPLNVLGTADTSFKKEAVALLLEFGADPKITDKQGRTPIHAFLSGKWPWSESADCIDMLLKAGADLSAKDVEGRTPLHYFAALGTQRPTFFIRNLDAKFIASKIDLQARDAQGDTPLHVAAGSDTSDVFQWLVKNGADPEATNNAGETPRALAAKSTNVFSRIARPPAGPDIFQAVSTGQTDAVERLLTGDRNLANATNAFGASPLRTAVAARRTNMIELLEQHGARWDAVTAVLAGRTEILRDILQQQPSAVFTTNLGSGLVHLAVINGNIEVLKILANANADLRAPDDWGISPVGHAVFRKQDEAFFFLQQNGSSMSIFDAVFVGDLKSTSALLAKNKALVFTTNSAGTTLVEMAAAMGHAEILKLLLDKGGRADAANPVDGMTPLHYAAMRNRTNTMDILLRNRAKIEVFNHSGAAPLHWAAFTGSADALTLLLKQKANPNVLVISATPPQPAHDVFSVSLAGSTALHLAALNGKANVIPLLLASGASINVTNSVGKTPLDLAGQAGIPVERSGTQFGRIRVIEPPGTMTITPDSSFSGLMERRRAAAALLETSGGKRSGTNRSGLPNRVGF